MAELEEGLLQWSNGRADWQKDLLRRLAAGEVLSSRDIRNYATAAERVELAATVPWYAPPNLGDAPSLTPLDATHLTATVVGGDPVQLVQIVHIEGANSLAPGAEVVFNPSGLTIIAGRNGSGKSGYTRILKQVAATRGSEPVLPNAFNPEVVPKAVVKYQVGSVIDQELTWSAEGDRAETPLQRVRVFDARSANVHLAGSTEIAYFPSALQVLAEYTNVLQAIAAVVGTDLEAARLGEKSWPELEDGPGQDIFENLGQQEALTAIQAVRALTEDEQKELQALPGKLSELATTNPATLAVQARQRAGQLNTLARNLESIASKLTTDAVTASNKLRADLKTAIAAAVEAQQAIETGEPGSGVGSEAWKAMWLAAEAYIQGNDHEHTFPEVGEAATCPLCEQRLDDEAQERFRKYAEFMRGEAEVARQAAATLRNADIDALKGLPLDTLITQDLVDLVKTYNEKVGDALLPLISRATTLRDELVGEDEPDESAVDAAKLETAFTKVISGLRDSATAETTAAAQFDATDTSGIAAAQLAERQSVLTVRKGLATHLDAIGKQHDLAIRVTALEAARSACDTTGASRKNSELSRSYVDKVCARFEEEATALGLSRVPVELVFDRSSRGVSYLKVSLKGAPGIAVSSVLSEGEQRVTAIAGFFADLTESGDTSTLVFDDPVSSLDQEFRVLVARRLLEEAESRQVLVFTHDFSFVQYLYEEKVLRDKTKVRDGETPAEEITYTHIDRAPAGAGVVTTAEQWRHVGVKERIGRLKQRIQSAGVLYRNNDVTGYEKEGRDIVGALRDTWEAFVEQELLNGVVTRHERTVQTQRLSALTDLDAADIAAVDLGMKVESRYMTGHAAPISDASAVGGPDWLLAEVAQLETFRKAVLGRR